MPLPRLESDLASLQGSVERIEVHVDGHIDPSLVRGLVATRAGHRVDRDQIRTDIRRIFALGNFEDVAVKATPAGPSWVLRYEVRERPVLEVVRFQGIPADWRAEIAAVAGQHAGDLYVPAAVHGASSALRDHLRDQGHARATVRSFVRRPDSRRAALCFDIDAGPVVRVQAVHFDGSEKLRKEELSAAMRTAGVEHNLPGSFVREDVLENQLLHVSAAYYDAGMVGVRLGDPDIRYSKDGTMAVIHIPVTEGPVYRIGRIELGDALKPNAVRYRSVLPLRSGGTFDRSKLMHGIQKIQEIRAAEGASGSIVPETNVDSDRHTIHITLEVSQ